MIKSDASKLLKKNQQLNHFEDKKVVSHTQRQSGEWFINAIMIDGYDVPFKYKRRKQYKNLTGARVNVTYYPVTEEVVGLPFETMKVVRIRIT
ncbi:MAG: hypothetical protein ACI9VI_003199 [Candidatus Azotimanducaceae bacterium]